MYKPIINKDESILGIYIRLPEPYEKYIRQYRINNGQDSAALCPTHITLLPPTAVKKENIENFIKKFQKQLENMKSFWIQLNGVSSFEPISNVSYISVSDGNKECDFLYKKILEILKLDIKSMRFDFHPHVTITHDASHKTTEKLEKIFANFRAAFICTQFNIDILDENNYSNTIATLTLN